MDEPTDTARARSRGRRRFLGDALKGAASLLTGAAAGSTAVLDDPATPPPPSPPPEAAEIPPEEVKQSLDRLQEEFARDNPGSSRYPSA